jgi:hypothetical protein
MTAPKIYAVSMTLKNILGIREFSVDMESGVTILSGENGVGKSSVLKGYKCLIGGGNLATLKSKDAPEDEPAEGVLVLDGDAGRMIIEKINNKLTVKQQVGDSQAFKKVNAPQKVLDALFDGPSMNPVEFIAAKKERRIELLLEAMPIEFNPTSLWERIGFDPAGFDPVPTGIHPLKQIDRIRGVIYKARTGVNVDHQGKKKTAEQLRRDLPAEMPTVEGIAEIDAELQAIRESVATRRESIDGKCKARKVEAARALDAKEAELRDDLAQLEAKLRAEMEAELKDRRALADAEMGDAQAEYRDAHAIADDVRLAELSQVEADSERASQLAADLAELREREKHILQLQNTARIADENEQGAEELKKLSDRMTAALKEIDLFRSELAKNIPIDGLEIKDGEMYIDGVAWPTVNSAAKLKTAVTLSTLRFKDGFKPVFIDDAEKLDPDNFKALVAELKAAGATAFIARVDGGEMKVTK